MKPTDSVSHDEEENQRSQARMLRAVALIMAIASSVLLIPVYLTTHNQWETAATAIFAVYSWTFLWLSRQGRIQRVGLWMVLAVLCLAIVAVVAFGSVRTSASFLFVGAIAGAGILLGRLALIWCVVFTTMALGALTLAERAGWMHAPNMEVGLKTWLTQGATLVIVALIIYHARRQMEQSNERLRDELALRQQTESERDRSLERFARIFNSSPTPMLAQSGRDGLILDVNAAFERCYGYSKSEVVGQSDEMLWASAAERGSYLNGLLRDRRATMRSVQGRRRNGELFDADISSEMGTDDEDLMVITTVSDVTEQRKAVERLRRSEERFAKAFRLSPLNMRITRLADGQVLEFNQPNDQGEMALQARASGHGPNLTIWRDTADREAYVREMLEKGHVRGWERTLQLPDGRQRIVRLWSERIDIEGEVCALSCVIDVTREVHRERLLSEIAEGLATQGSEVFFPAMARHLAQALEADCVKVSELAEQGQMQELAVWADGSAVAPSRHEIAGTPCEQVLQSGTTLVVQDELPSCFPLATALAQSGLRAYMGHCLRDEDGSPVGMISVFWRRRLEADSNVQRLLSIFASRTNAELLRMRRDREIRTLNSSLEQRVLDRTAELQKLNQELDAFAYSVSHDLKSPLRAIDGFTQLLSESLSDRIRPDEAQLFRRVLAAARRMSTLIADMLALARVSQGALHRQLVDLSAMAGDVARQLASRHKHRRIEFDIQPGLLADCDPGLLRIALENLLGNAVKYTHSRDIAHVSFGQVDEPVETGQPERYYVRDDGVGFDMTYQDKLFKPFQRLHMPDAGFEGTGIGLATVHRIIERHGGEVSGKGRPGEGAEFRFSLGHGQSAGRRTGSHT
jgi:PAS domain S-box-containing protein